jgi:hypothetical protein
VIGAIAVSCRKETAMFFPVRKSSPPNPILFHAFFFLLAGWVKKNFLYPFISI